MLLLFRLNVNCFFACTQHFMYAIRAKKMFDNISNGHNCLYRQKGKTSKLLLFDLSKRIIKIQASMPPKKWEILSFCAARPSISLKNLQFQVIQCIIMQHQTKRDDSKI